MWVGGVNGEVDRFLFAPRRVVREARGSDRASSAAAITEVVETCGEGGGGGAEGSRGLHRAGGALRSLPDGDAAFGGIAWGPALAAIVG